MVPWFYLNVPAKSLIVPGRNNMVEAKNNMVPGFCVMVGMAGNIVWRRHPIVFRISLIVSGGNLMAAAGGNPVPAASGLAAVFSPVAGAGSKVSRA